jgi:hypothetical protein
MNGNKSKNSLKNIASLLGGASASALLCLPALALLNPSQNSLNQSLNKQVRGVQSNQGAEQFLAQTQPGGQQPTDQQPGFGQPTQTTPGTAPGTTPGVDQPTQTAPGTTPGVDQPTQTAPGTTPGVDQPTQTTPGTTPEVDQPTQDPGVGQPTDDNQVDNGADTGVTQPADQGVRALW